MLTTTKKIPSIIGLLGVISLLSISPAQAANITFDNTDFESDFTGWTTVGDTSIQELFEGLLQYENKQALIGTGCPNTAIGRCGDSGAARNDDLDLLPDNFAGTESSGGGYFNFSGNSQVDADGDPYTGSFSTNLLQDFLGLGQSSLHIPRENATLSGTRTPKEGSAIRQTITVDTPFTVSFNWSFLTNDESDVGNADGVDFGDRDYSFVSLYDTNSSIESRNVEILADTGDTTLSSNTSFTSGTHTGGNGTGDYNSYTSAHLPAGTYVVGLGVVDVDGDERTSGLFVDNFVIQEVPFEFSPAMGIFIVAGMVGCDRLRRKLQ